MDANAGMLFLWSTISTRVISTDISLTTSNPPLIICIVSLNTDYLDAHHHSFASIF